MTKPAASVTVALRIPAPWSHPKELLARLPADIRLTPDELVLPDGVKVEFGALPPDDQFAGIFRGSCRHATDDELDAVDHYAVNLTLSGPGGSLDAAQTMMKAASSLVRAGGAGVFIDNSGVAHGGRQWLELTEDGGADALSFAFVAIVGGDSEVYTMGMHVLGQPEVFMNRADVEGGFDIIEVIRYLCTSEKPIGDRHVIADLDGPRFQVFAHEDAEFPAGSPFYNPFGRFRLVSLKDIAEAN